MIFKKPDDVTYTDMCIYIDENIYAGTYNIQSDLINVIGEKE